MTMASHHTDPTALAIDGMDSGHFEHFDALYASNSDPWGYKSLWYERRRFALIAAMLDKQLYESGFEPGCSNGTLTAKLAPRCRQLLAVDGSQEAVLLAQQSTHHLANVKITKGEVPTDWPHGTFDLIVLSDFLYYLHPEAITDVAMKSKSSLRKRGTILAGHWKGSAHDFLTPGGDCVHAILSQVLGPPNGGSYADSDQLISTWVS